MSADAELLQRYVGKRDETAFAELVRRHLGLVYGAALRRTCGRRDLAEEVAQKVFTAVARKAALLSHHPNLAAWLHRSTRYVAIDVLRAEGRNRVLKESFAVMSSHEATDGNPAQWERLRPLIDDALDGLREADREAMLLRYFEGLSFADIGHRLRLSENAARMRTERALEKLRAQLGRRGVTSTSAALGLLLANQAFATAPATLATSVTATALAGAPAGGGIVSLILMSKITVPVCSALVASGVTALIWTSVVPTVSADELAALRKENARLTQAMVPGVSAAEAAAAAQTYANEAVAVTRAMAERRAKLAGVQPAGGRPAAGSTTSAPAVTARGHRDRGTATPRDAGYTFAWASDICDPAVMARLVHLDPDARARAIQILDSMPPEVRAQYPTPETFYGLLLALSCLGGPPPGADVLEAMEPTIEQVEVSPGRVAFRPKGSNRTIHEFQLTGDGWKYVLPLAGVEGLPNNLSNESLARLAEPPRN